MLWPWPTALLCLPCAFECFCEFGFVALRSQMEKKKNMSHPGKAAPPLPSLFSYTHVAGVSWEGSWFAPHTWQFIGLARLASWRGAVLLIWTPAGIALALWRFCVLLAFGMPLPLIFLTFCVISTGFDV